MEKKSIEITKEELGDVLQARENHSHWLFSQRGKNRSRAKRAEIDTERTAIWARIKELNAIFDAWSGEE